jgi:hypothetical protein
MRLTRAKLSFHTHPLGLQLGAPTHIPEGYLQNVADSADTADTGDTADKTVGGSQASGPQATGSRALAWLEIIGE